MNSKKIPSISPLKKSQIKTPLGTMLAIGSETHLYALGFTEYNLELEIEEKLKMKTGRQILIGCTPVIKLTAEELNQYFAGTLKNFTTPIVDSGTPFQRRVWKELGKIPFGQTKSYGDIAKTIGNPQGYRAVARANAANPIAIIIGCHRIINKSGNLGGYAAGIDRKKWLINHESKFI